jgi:hypothetical protein
MAELNEKFDVKVTAEKAASDGGAVAAGGTLGTAVGGLLVATLRGRGLSPWPEGMDVVAVGVVATVFGSAVAMLKRAKRNIKKNRFLGLVVVAGLCLGGLSGCITTTLPDGTVVQSLDTAALKEAYGVYLLEEERRAREGRPGTGVDVKVEGVVVDIDAVKEELRDRGVRIKN